MPGPEFSSAPSLSSCLDTGKQDAQLGWPGVSHLEARAVLELKPQVEGRRDPDSVKTFRVGRERHRERERRREGGRERADPEDHVSVPALYLNEGEAPHPLSSPPPPLLLPDTGSCRLAVVL